VTPFPTTALPRVALSGHVLHALLVELCTVGRGAGVCNASLLLANSSHATIAGTVRGGSVRVNTWLIARRKDSWCVSCVRVCFPGRPSRHATPFRPGKKYFALALLHSLQSPAASWRRRRDILRTFPSFRRRPMVTPHYGDVLPRARISQPQKDMARGGGSQRLERQTPMSFWVEGFH